MSKEIYIVNCYTCQHNGQETCKGCNTLLNGDVEPYKNWELREDLSQKDQRIAELEQELAELKEKLSKATQFETPHIERFALVRYLAQKNEPYKIVNCYDAYRDKNYKTNYCFYNVKSMNFKLIEVFATEQEAQAKLKEIQGNG